MPAGGGDPKQIGDGQVVKIRPELGRGNSDVWDLRDITIALIEERQELFAAIAAAADHAAFKTAAALLTPKLEIIDAAPGV